MDDSPQGNAVRTHSDINGALERFEKAGNEIVDCRISKLHEPQTSPDIYHYTTDVGLRGILESGKLWLTGMFSLEHFHSCYRVPKRVLNQASAFPGESCGSNSEMASSSASLVRALAERNSILSLAQAFSMGFKSGE